MIPEDGRILKHAIKPRQLKYDDAYSKMFFSGNDHFPGL